MEKGQICNLTIEDISNEGSGIGRAEGLVVFVPGALPGDFVNVRLAKVKKNYAIAKLIEITEPSSHRVDDFGCPYSRQVESEERQDEAENRQACGGCPYSQLDYEMQCSIKEKQVKDKLERIAGVSFGEGKALLHPVLQADAVYGYRNKAVMPISTGGFMTQKGGVVCPEHEPRIGFRPAKSNDVIDCESCLLQTETAMAAAAATRRYMEEDNICSFDTRWDKGLMKGMTVKTAFGTGEVMVVYDINGKGIPNAAKLLDYLDSAIYEAGGNLESVAIRNDKKTETLAGKSTITDEIEIDLNEATGKRVLQFEISANSFYQTNHEQMQKLYSLVRNYCKQVETRVGKNPIVFDLYCGIGTIGLCVADIAEHVYGIEIVKQAVLDANRNATINGIVNATYTCGKAEEEIDIILDKIKENDEKSGRSEERSCIAILDPPRAGCKEGLLKAIAKADIENIIYVSCDAGTLARDVKILREEGYELVEATPVDMFPHTSHVETVVLLVKER